MHLLIGLTETLGRLNSAKPQSGIVPLLDPPMTLLNRVAQAGVIEAKLQRGAISVKRLL